MLRLLKELFFGWPLVLTSGSSTGWMVAEGGSSNEDIISSCLTLVMPRMPLPSSLKIICFRHNKNNWSLGSGEDVNTKCREDQKSLP